MGFAEGVSTGDERNCFLVVHRHTRKSLANISGCSERIRVAVWPLRIYVDQTHLHGGERLLEFPVAGVAFVTEPLVLRTPVNVFFGLPNVCAPASEAKCLEPHRF